MDPIAALTTITVLGVIVKSLVDALRRQYPRVDGIWPQLFSWALGGGMAWALDIQGTEALLDYLGATAGREPIASVDYLLTGAAIAAGAGFLAEISGRSASDEVIIEVDDSGEPVH